MNGTDIFIDTNICIYLLNGDAVLSELLQDQNIYLSIITEMELSAYHGNNKASLETLAVFLQSVSVINIEEPVKINTIEIRKQTKLKLPDCIIAASALTHNMPFITADRAFKKIKDFDLIIYEKS